MNDKFVLNVNTYCYCFKDFIYFKLRKKSSYFVCVCVVCKHILRLDS